MKLASGKQAAKAMERFLPVLKRLKKNKKLIMVPTPRFVCKACCIDKNHCVNRSEEGFFVRYPGRDKGDSVGPEGLV